MPRPVPTVPPHVPRFDSLEQLAGLYPELDATAIHTCVTLMRVATQLLGSFDEHFARFGLSQGRFTLLMLLRKRHEGMSPAELAAAAGVTRPTITGVLHVLERDGLVERRRCTADHRAIIVTLTPAARRLLKRMLPAHFRKHASVMSALDSRDRERLIELLRRLEPAVAAGGSS